MIVVDGMCGVPTLETGAGNCSSILLIVERCCIVFAAMVFFVFCVSELLRATYITVAMASTPTPPEGVADLETLIQKTKQNIAEIEAAQKAGRPVIPESVKKAASARSGRVLPLAIAIGLYMATVETHWRRSKSWKVGKGGGDHLHYCGQVCSNDK